MRTSRTFRLLAAATAVGSLAFAPATTLSDGSGAEADPGVHGPCGQTTAVLVGPDTPFESAVATPVGIANLTDPTDAADVVVDLSGLPLGTTAEVTVTLDWDLPAPAGDYDLRINSVNDLSTDQPEVETLTRVHCSHLDIDTEVFSGTPFDSLTLRVEVEPSA